MGCSVNWTPRCLRKARSSSAVTCLRDSAAAVSFLAAGPAGRCRGDPTRPVAVLRRRWLEASPIVYIGKADLRTPASSSGLRKQRELVLSPRPFPTTPDPEGRTFPAGLRLPSSWLRTRRRTGLCAIFPGGAIRSAPDRRLSREERPLVYSRPCRLRRCCWRSPPSPSWSPGSPP